MTKDEAFTRAYGENLIAYLLAGVALTLIQVIDSKFRSRYASKGFIVFLVQVSKGIIPLSLLATLLRGTGNSSLGEAMTVWLIVVVMIYVFVSPLYLMYWLYKMVLKRIKK